MTSNNVVGAIKKCLDQKKVGHAGTLDPAASGVLPVFLGKATKLFDYLVEGEKEYIGEIAFGCATDTQDAQGKVVARSNRIVGLEEAKVYARSFFLHRRFPTAKTTVRRIGCEQDR